MRRLGLPEESGAAYISSIMLALVLEEPNRMRATLVKRLIHELFIAS